MTARASIACIAWGSLVWDPRELPCVPPWRDDGPLLPVEFARESADRRITLVICDGVPTVRCSWSPLTATTLSDARRALGLREFGRPDAPGIDRCIGWWDRATDDARGRQADVIAAWAASHDLSGVVWTDLPPRFGGVEGRVPAVDQVLTHLRALPADARQRAETYVRRAPVQTDTLVRRRIAAELGWTPAVVGLPGAAADVRR